MLRMRIDAGQKKDYDIEKKESNRLRNQLTCRLRKGSEGLEKGIQVEKAEYGAAVRMKDIAEHLGVSSVSVHRALSGKEGISDALRQKILKTAEEMGYTANYAAASIKRKVSRIAVVLPQDEPGKSYYFDYIWKGVREQAEEVRGLNVELAPFPCADEEAQFALLREIADGGPEEFAGVVTYSYTRMPKVLLQLQRLVTLGITTVVIDDELKVPEGISCITANEKTTGSAAGELINLITPETGTVLVSGGRMDSKTHQNKLGSMASFLKERKPGLKLVAVGGYYKGTDIERINYQAVCEALKQHPDTVAVCAMTSLDNLPMEKAVRDLGLRDRIRIVGIDLNFLTAQMLMEDRIDAVVNQGAYQKGYQAFKIVTDGVVKHLQLPDVTGCAIDIVLKSNLRFYKEWETCGISK